MQNRKLSFFVISGATSPIGIATIKECIKNNKRVIALCNHDSKNLWRIPNDPLVKVIEIGMEEYCSFMIDRGDLLSNPEDSNETGVFVHLAWAATAGELARNRIIPQANNILFSLSAVDLAAKMGCSVFIGAGSQAEYGRTNETLTEETECHPETAYGIAKLCAGQLTRLACKQKGMVHIWTRILSAYGPYCSDRTVVNYAITELMAGREPEFTACEQLWDFIYVNDVARALFLLALMGREEETYVIGQGESEKLKDYIERIRDIVSPQTGLKFGIKEYSDSSIMHLSCDISKLVNHTGFKAETSFDNGIKETVLWYLSNEN